MFFSLGNELFCSVPRYFFRFKGKRWQEISHQGKGKTKAGTQHGLFMTQELSSCVTWGKICSLSGFLFSMSLERND